MLAALQASVGMINVESAEELDVLARVARSAGIVAPTAIRVNPEVQVHVHPYTATGVKGKKFGVPHDEVEELAVRAASMEGLALQGLAMHLGSGITEVAPFQEAVVKLLDVVAKVRQHGVTLTRLDLGGGLGIRYRSTDQPLAPQRFAEAIVPLIADAGLTLMVEPGRFIIGGAGQLLTRVLYRKKSGGKLIAVVDAGMTDLIRPSHYQAYHEILVDGGSGRPHAHYDVVGPICESGDFFALDRELPALEQGDLLALQGAGAYGFVMTSTYNARPRPPEVLVDGDRFAVVRSRETAADLMRGETLEPSWQHAGAGAGVV
jgi:diaminopimelate decarboxylase